MQKKWRSFWQLGRQIADLHVSLYAANASFFIILSLFPGLVLVLALLRHTGLEAETLLSVLEGFVPQVLFPAVRHFIRTAYRNTAVLSLSALAALWSAGRGIHGLITGMNAIYGVQDTRGYFYTRAVSTGYTFAFLALLMLTLLFYVFGNSLLRAFPVDSMLLRFLDDVIGVRFLLLLLLQTGLFSAMNMAFPNVTVTFRQAFPGALLSSLGWLSFSSLYSFYVEHFAGYAGIYDCVYAMAIGMLWLYFCISIVFYGAVLNRFIRRQ